MSIKVVTVGLRGYATTYVHPLLNDMDKGKYTYAGIIARDATKSKFYDRIVQNHIPVFKTLTEYFEKGHTADLVVICTPPHLHRSDSLLAVKNGANVLCEKPITPLYEDALTMQKTSEEKDKFIAIGYQWSYSNAIRTLKEDILAGALGRAKKLKSFVSWPRGWEYYEGGWKGKICDAEGNWILDSVASNAAAHYLHNLYFLLGETMDNCAFPETIHCELFRANEIESYDTCLLDITTQNDVKLFYAVSHATEKEEEPKFSLEFENATVYYNTKEVNNRVIAQFADGSRKDYGDPGEGLNNRLWEAIDAAVTRKPMTCVVKTAIAHTLTINKLHRYGEIIHFPEHILCIDQEKRQTTVNGLYDLLYKAYEKGKLFSDMGVDWARAQSFSGLPEV